MFGTLGRRAVDSVVALFAILGFCFVPLGSKTGLEHTLALLRTASVREAGAGVLTALGRARSLLLETLVPARTDTAPLPMPSGSAVRAVPPPLH